MSSSQEVSSTIPDPLRQQKADRKVILALDLPFLLLPFRPASDPSAARTFIRNFFSMEKGADMKGERLEQELILTEPMVNPFFTPFVYDYLM